MGITNLWEVLGPAFQPRIPFESFVVDFIERKGRPPRIAIDAYMFIYTSGHKKIKDDISTSTQSRNFMTKMLYLSTLNVTYVVVFDGSFKPAKIKNGRSKMNNYYDQLDTFMALQSKRFFEDNDLVRTLIRIIRQHNIDYIQSPGEAEAECANLQRYGAVDYVLSNDSDVFVFGARNVLRNFNRYSEEGPNSPRKNQPSTHYYVTPVYMDHIEEKIGLDIHSLILIATLRGGDYSNGIDGIGIKNATNLARCGLKVEYNNDENKEIYKHSECPNFSKMLINCFIKDNYQNVFGYDAIQDRSVTKAKLERFNFILNTAIKSKPRDIFGRNLVFEEEFFIDQHFTLFYLFPFVNQKLYMFIPGTLSNGSITFDDKDLDMSYMAKRGNHKISKLQSIDRFNNTYSSPQNIIGHSDMLFSGSREFLSNITQNFVGVKSTDRKLEKHRLVLDYRYPANGLIAKVFAVIDSYEELIKYLSISNIKVKNDIEHVMVKFNEIQIKLLMTNEGESDDECSSLPEKSKYIWIPRKILDYLDKDYVEKAIKDLMHLKEKHNLPKKRKVQKTTLDDFGKFPLSPTKKKKQHDDSKPQITNCQQSVIDGHWKQAENPFLVDPETLNRQHNKLKLKFLKAPKLSAASTSFKNPSDSPSKTPRTNRNCRQHSSKIGGLENELEIISISQESGHSNEESLIEVDPETVQHLFL